MEKGIRRISKKSPFYDMFNIKRIKMLLDSPMQNVREKAVQELQQVADNVNNYYAQEALWTLGAYQSHQGNLTAAIEAWKKLAQEGQSEKALISSPWVIGAQDKLKSLHVEVALNN